MVLVAVMGVLHHAGSYAQAAMHRIILSDYKVSIISLLTGYLMKANAEFK